ncbi:MAG: peptidoglycan-binding protein LysM [Methylococcaceae bacterium]|jgi:nucleoid-associated protein YgaU|nr:peptidoglycan-binding protein LysM [Methylococcaceae bacterium]
MSLLDFVKDIGHSLFNSDDKAAEKIKEHILADNPGIDPLEVKFEKGFVTLGGSSQTWEAVEKAILLAGNVKGVGKVVSEIQVAEAAGNASVELGGTGAGQYYEIKSGDTLSAIAKHFYGDANQYQKIFEANREVIKDANKIFPGQKIRIPA